MAEQAFVEQLEHLVSHLAERLSGSDDGKPKVFRDSEVENLSEFFIRFQELNLSSNQQLDDLVDRCQQLVGGVEPQNLRDSDTLRRSFSNQLSSVQSTLVQMLVDRPRRNILRTNRRVVSRHSLFFLNCIDSVCELRDATNRGDKNPI
ncbi:hypothetical protein N9242_04735 [Vicingaceae bacterium]|nr:hypothetical protein [Vicingaceae bacterium]